VLLPISKADVTLPLLQLEDFSMLTAVCFGVTGIREKQQVMFRNVPCSKQNFRMNECPDEYIRRNIITKLQMFGFVVRN
jgi:hypothetical protein